MSARRKSLRDYASQQEDEGLEFKDPRVLSDPWTIAREVCAFLNTTLGGQLVIGIGDDGAVVPIERPEEEQGRLWSRLVSSIAPSLPSRVRAEVLRGGGLLVEVGRVEELESIHAVRSTKGRLGVFRRVGDRVVPLDWTEIREAVRREDGPGTDGPSTETELNAWRKKLQGLANLDRAGALMMVFTREPRIDSSPETKDRLRSAIENPTTLGLRDAGMNYSRRQWPESKRNLLYIGVDKELHRALELDPRGVLRFGTRLDHLLGDGISGCPRSRTIYPLSLIETIVSCAVLFSALVESSSARGKVTCAMDLVGIQGHSLPPYRHGTHGFMFDQHWTKPHSDSGLSEIIRSSCDAKAFAENPHRLASDLILWIYEEFGYDSSVLGQSGEKVPFWNDESGRFEFPD